MPNSLNNSLNDTTESDATERTLEDEVAIFFGPFAALLYDADGGVQVVDRDEPTREFMPAKVLVARLRMLGAL